jgi:ABC-type Fe3+/spermidine/putrescine transport system ATPase subunit
MATVQDGAVNTTDSPLIEARGLRLQFGKVTALDGLDLVARPGQVLAILGPNSAGKSTFIRAVATLVRPSGGELRVRGTDVTRDPAAVRRPGRRPHLVSRPDHRLHPIAIIRYRRA